MRGSTKGTRAKTTVAKRTRAQFGDGDDTIQHPCKRAMVNAPDKRTDADIARQRELALTFLAHAEAVQKAAAATAPETSRIDGLTDDDSLLALGLVSRRSRRQIRRG